MKLPDPKPNNESAMFCNRSVAVWANFSSINIHSDPTQRMGKSS
jgi:hypothetical protein